MDILCTDQHNVNSRIAIEHTHHLPVRARNDLSERERRSQGSLCLRLLGHPSTRRLHMTSTRVPDHQDPGINRFIAAISSKAIDWFIHCGISDSEVGDYVAGIAGRVYGRGSAFLAANNAHALTQIPALHLPFRTTVSMSCSYRS